MVRPRLRAAASTKPSASARARATISASAASAARSLTSARGPRRSITSAIDGRTDALRVDAKVLGFHHVAPAQNDRALDPVLKFPNVPGPGVLGEHPNRVRREGEGATAAGLPGELRQERLREGKDVVPPGPQRRDQDLDHGETEIEILSKIPGSDHRLQVAVRGRDQPKIHPPGLGAPHPVELLLLNEPQDLGLQGERQVPDLVQKQGAPLGHLDPPELPGAGPGEGPLLVAEEFVLEERLRDGRAIDGDERPLGAGRELVNRAGQKLLARAAFAEDQDRALAGRHALNLKQRGLEALARADEPGQRHSVLQLLLEKDRSTLQPAAGQGSIDEEEQMVEVDGLGQEIGGALADRPHRVLDRPERGHDDHVGLGAPRSWPPR